MDYDILFFRWFSAYTPCERNLDLAMRSNPFLKTAAAFALCLVAASALGCNGKKGTAVVLISLDTLRRGNLGCYGYERDTSPNIDRFAREDAIVFDAVYAQAPYTLPSHMSMLTGLYPEAHKILVPVINEGKGRIARLADGVTTLAEAFQEHEFETQAFTDGLLMDGKYGFDQGFEEYLDERSQNVDENGFRRYGDSLHEWIRGSSDEDFFLFIHTYDTHSPYCPPEPFLSRFKGKTPGGEFPDASIFYCEFIGYHSCLMLEQYNTLQDIVDDYDGGVAYVDHEMGRLFDLLKALDLWENSLVIVTTDHGESFMENDMYIGHGLSTNNEETLIPLIIKFPGSPHAGERVEHVVESVDIMPTMLSAMGIKPPPGIQGQNILDGLDNGRWKKNHGYGMSPHTGGNHYFFQNGIKYIEATNDPKGYLMRGHLMPSSPPTCIKPKKPYYRWASVDRFYDFDEDPLGVSELFNQGDRAYDLSETDFECKAEQIDDRDLLKQYKKAASTLAAWSSEIGIKLSAPGEAGEDTESSSGLSPEEREQLIALGYAGIIASESMADENASEGAAQSSGLIITPPLVDRSLLIRGDSFLWDLYRFMKKKDITFKPSEIDMRLEKAGSCFERFKQLYPDKESMVEWRLKCLDLTADFFKRQKKK